MDHLKQLEGERVANAESYADKTAAREAEINMVVVAVASKAGSGKMA